MATGLENLWIYQLAEDLEVEVYEVTKSFPKDEIFIRFLKLNDLTNHKPKKPKQVTKKP